MKNIKNLFSIAFCDLIKIRRDPIEWMSRIVQPVIWLLLFGEVMSKTFATKTGFTAYLSYIFPGILCQSLLNIAIFYGLSLVREKSIGTLDRILIAPISRIQIILGKCISAIFRSTFQIIPLYFLSWILGLNLKISIIELTFSFIILFVGCAIFTNFSMIIASLVKREERLIGVGQAIIMPLFFASNALYPIELMPKWIQFIALINPISYQIDALRELMIEHHPARFGVGVDLSILIVFFLFTTTIATKLFSRFLY